MSDDFLDPRELIKKTNLNTGVYISIDEKKCNGCAKCVIICPVDLYRVVKKKSQLDPEEVSKWCLECGHCWVICPKNAISFHYPKGGSGIAYENG